MSSSSSGGPGGPKILLAKPGLVSGGPSAAGKFIRGTSAEEDTSSVSIRSRLPPVGSLNLLSDSWDFHFDRFLPFLTDNTEFTVVGVIGSPGVGKSSLMNVIYGFDPSSPGMLPPFAIQSEETRANARHCTIGIEPRISAERLILLDTQPVFSPSVLAEMTRPDGLSTVPVLGGETSSSELAYELLSIQLGVLLASVCHVFLVVSEGVHEANMWRLMSTVDLLKHGLPDPSSVTSHLQSSSLGSDKNNKDKLQEGGEEYIATPVFIHTKLRNDDLSPHNCEQMKKVLAQYFHSSSFTRSVKNDHVSFPKSCETQDASVDSKLLDLFLVPRKKDNSLEFCYESYDSMMWRIRDHILSMARPSFSRTVSERDWLKNTAKIWELSLDCASIPVAAVEESEKLVKETAQNVDVAVIELPDANKKLEDLWANHSKIVQPKPHRKDSATWKAIRKLTESGEQIGLKHFKPVRPLGAGDTGSVHLVELIGTGENFAMKAMDKNAMLNRNKVHRACAERDILDMLDHPFLPALYASFQTPTHICLITDYCPGGELFLLLDRQPAKVLKEDAARFYVAEVIIALEYLHCQGIIYGDLKPENILIQSNGHIALTDFDLSCLTSCMPQV